MGDLQGEEAKEGREKKEAGWGLSNTKYPASIKKKNIRLFEESGFQKTDAFFVSSLF